MEGRRKNCRLRGGGRRWKNVRMKRKRKNKRIMNRKKRYFEVATVGAVHVVR